MARTVRFHQTGGPEVLRLDDLDIPDPGPGEVRIRTRAHGVDTTTPLESGAATPTVPPAAHTTN